METQELQIQYRDVFVSYHMDSSEELVQKICTILEGRGISCWYASRDSKNAYSVEIVRAIRGCKVFLLILNEKSNISGHVQNEIHLAFNHSCHDSEMTLLPFRVDHCQLSESVDYYLGRQRFMDGTLPPEVARIQELTDRISEILGKKASRAGWVDIADSKAGTTGKAYKIISSMMYPDSQFVGRSKELEQMHDVLSGQENKVLLVGMGGIGKSEIAKMYCKQYGEDYDVIVWISYTDSLLETVCSDSLLQVEGISREDYANEDKRVYFSRKMQILKSIADRRVLFVVDNFDVTCDPDMKEFCSGSYGVIFTSRYRQQERSIKEVLISSMEDRDELMALFCSEYSRSMDEEAEQMVGQIIEQLSGHTLSVRLVASTMQKQRIKPEKMLELLQQKAGAEENKNQKAAMIIRERLHQIFNLANLNEDEQYLMKNLALFPLSGISVELFYEWCEMDDYDIIENLIGHSWMIHNPVTDEVHLHPMIGELFAEEIEKDPECCDTLLEHFIEANKDIANKKQALKNVLLEYVESISRRLPLNHPAYIRMRIIKATRLFDLSRYDESIANYREIMNLSKISLEDKLFCLVKISHMMVLLNKPEEAIASAQEGLKLLEGIPYDSFEYQIGISWREFLGRLGESYRLLGEYDESLKYLELALEYHAHYYRESAELGKGWGLYHCARTRIERGREEDLELCHGMLQEALDTFEEIKDEWSKSFTYDQIALIYARWGRFEEALELSGKAYNILLPLLGEEHMDIGNNLVHRGDIYKAMEDTVNANECYERAIRIYRKNKAVSKEEDVRRKLV